MVVYVHPCIHLDYRWLPKMLPIFVSLRGSDARPPSVSELVDVIGEAVGGVQGFVGVWTVVGALAGLNHHDVLVEGLAVVAMELHPNGSGVMWAAAAAIHARSTVSGSVLLHAGAAGVGELRWLAGLFGSATLFSFLQTDNEGISPAHRSGSDVFPVLYTLP